MPALTLTIDELRTAIARLAPPVVPLAPAGFALDPGLGRELVQILVSDVKGRFLSSTAPDGRAWAPLKRPRPSGGGKPLLDTGALMASISGRFTPTSVVVGTNRPGAALHQFGGTVRPVKGKFLAIPLTPMAKRAGSPRRLTGTAALPLFARRIEGELRGHFLLVKGAKVPARPFLGVSADGSKALLGAIGAAIARRWEAQGSR